MTEDAISRPGRFIAAGSVQTADAVRTALESGAVGVASSQRELWDLTREDVS